MNPRSLSGARHQAPEQGSTRLPTVVIFSFGSSFCDPGQADVNLADYYGGTLGLYDCTAAVREMRKYATIRGMQVACIPGADITDTHLLDLLLNADEALRQPDVSGIVIAAGMDILEEVAWFLDLCLRTGKPVIVTGATRPPSALSCDGSQNLLNAVRLAIDRRSARKGVLVVLDGTIHAARDVLMTSSCGTAAFQSPLTGALGFIAGGEPFFCRVPARDNTTGTGFPPGTIRSLPRVEILYTCTCQDRVTVDALLGTGADGIVVAGMGEGCIPEMVRTALAEASHQGVCVVISSRNSCGMVSPRVGNTSWPFISADTLSPQKARILLRLALAKTRSQDEIREMFSRY
ncbi:asparaginase [Methanoregula sp.]|jgi:L-asparaginase|uniref:asparaginase n=1 Tax=Methanoregula sp. TaxID=2052170 RepID=UPI003C15BCF1